MKKYTLFGSLLISSFCLAQNEFPTTGNAGIGISSAAASSPLHIKSSNDAIAAFQTTDDTFLYTQWLNKSGVRRAWMGLDNILGGFNISVENGTDKILFNGGNVGIGSVNPLARLEVRNGNILLKNLLNNDSNSAIMIAQSVTDGNHTELGTSIRSIVQSAGLNTYGMQFFTKESHRTAQTEKVRIQGDGNVGIGILEPAAKLAIQATTTGSNGGVRLHGFTNSADISYWSESQFAMAHSGQYKNLISSIGSSYFNGGNVGIGTSVPDEKLTVNGKIHAQEVRIDLASPMTVPDYVFANDYKLKTLKEVESYIKENSHLPEIPSAKEIEKNGLMLAEMNMNLLKKVEELTLYAIEQQKNTEQLTKIIQEQNKRLEVLEKSKK
ncbi:tail fiber protein [Flavobacterium poyangense]|uniref:tail fiber protein n=1 Tax=Flavobacterium poyangense TaxID=2204302 RepID=UPI0014247AF8|nr:tail fiber protein [Flavobacterium sp. JXAS1]